MRSLNEERASMTGDNSKTKEVSSSSKFDLKESKAREQTPVPEGIKKSTASKIKRFQANTPFLEQKAVRTKGRDLKLKGERFKSSESVKQVKSRKGKQNVGSTLDASKTEMDTDKITENASDIEFFTHFEIGESSSQRESVPSMKIYGENDSDMEKAEKQDENQSKYITIDAELEVDKNSRLQTNLQKLSNGSRRKYDKKTKKKERKPDENFKETFKEETEFFKKDLISNEKTETVATVKSRAGKTKASAISQGTTSDQDSHAIYHGTTVEGKKDRNSFRILNEDTSEEFEKIPKEINAKRNSLNVISSDQVEDQDSRQHSLRTIQDPGTRKEADVEINQDKTHFKIENELESLPRDCQITSPSDILDSSKEGVASIASDSPRSGSHEGTSTLSGVIIIPITQGISRLEYSDIQSDDQKSVYSTPPNLEMEGMTCLTPGIDIKGVKPITDEIPSTTSSCIKEEVDPILEFDNLKNLTNESGESLASNQNSKASEEIAFKSPNENAPEEQQVVKPNSLTTNSSPTSVFRLVYDSRDMTGPLIDTLNHISDPSDNVDGTSVVSNVTLSLEDLSAECNKTLTSEMASNDQQVSVKPEDTSSSTAEVEGIHSMKTLEPTSSYSDNKFDDPQHSSTDSTSRSWGNFPTENLVPTNLEGGTEELRKAVKSPSVIQIDSSTSKEDDDEGQVENLRKDGKEELVEKLKLEITSSISDTVSTPLTGKYTDEVQVQQSSRLCLPENTMKDSESSSMSKISSGSENFPTEESVPTSINTGSDEKETEKTGLENMVVTFEELGTKSKTSIPQNAKNQDAVGSNSDESSISLNIPPNEKSTTLIVRVEPEESPELKFPGTFEAMVRGTTDLEPNEQQISRSNTGTEDHERLKVKVEIEKAFLSTKYTSEKDGEIFIYPAADVIHVASTSTSYSKDAIPTIAAPQSHDESQASEVNKENTPEILVKFFSSDSSMNDETVGLQHKTFEHGVPLSSSELETKFFSPSYSNDKPKDVAPGQTSSHDFNSLRRLTPLSLGLETVGGVMTPVIPRNTALPVHRKQLISTHTDNQTEVLVHIFEGERLWVRENKMLGSFEIKGIARAPRGEPLIPIHFEIAANGILNVLLEREEKVGEQTVTRLSLAISNVRVRPDRQKISEMIEDEEKHRIEDYENRKIIQLKDSFEHYVYWMRNIIVDKRIAKLVDPKEKEEMVAAVQSALNWLKLSNWFLYNRRQVPEFQEIHSQRRNLQGICDPIIRRVSKRNNSTHVGG
ncbi:hypothetical protein R1flu_019314 [Riccia fluitans]|uniref:Uncharacterized protein n=1 Tax=Riccia fluitans TaxID=41844 RepID=A0ABD1ZKI2_9MARC